MEAVAFSPDGRWLVSVGGSYRQPEKSGEVRVWDIAATSTRPRWAFEPETGPISGLAFAPDGKTFATSGGDGSVHLWGLDPADAVRYQEPDQLWPIAAIAPAKGLDGAIGVMSLAVSPDGSLLAAGTRHEIRTYQLPAGTERGVLRGHESGVMKLAFSRDGRRLASSAADGSNRVWDITGAGKELGILKRPYVTTWPIAFTADGSKLLVTWRDNFLYAWDFTTGSRQPVGSQYRAGGLELSPDGESLAVFGERDPSGVISIMRGGKVAMTLPTSSEEPAGLVEVAAVKFAPDGKTIYSAQQRRLKTDPDGAGKVDGPDLRSDEVFELVSWSDANGKLVQHLPAVRGPIRDITVSPDGKTLVLAGGRAGTQSGEAYLWHAGESQVAATLGGHRGPVRAAASPARAAGW